MVKIIRIIGVAMFLLTVSSAAWAGVDEPASPTPTPTPTVTVPRSTHSPRRANYYHNDDYYARHPSAPQSNAYLNSTAYQNWRKQEMDTHQRVEYLNTPQPQPQLKVLYITRPTPRPFVGSAAMSMSGTVTCNGGPCPTATSTATPTPTPSPTPTREAPASNRPVPK